MTTWWQRGISLVVLTALTALPLSAAVCATLCAPQTAAAVLAGSDSASAPCHEAPAPEGLEIGGTSAHECGGHDQALRDTIASLTAARADSRVLSVTAAAWPADPAPAAAGSMPVYSGSSPPPTPASRLRILALRI